MNRKIERKALGRLGLKYGIIIVIINFLGFLVAISENMPTASGEDVKIWVDYIDSHSMFFNTLSVLSFAVPVIFCIWYVCLCPKDKVVKRIINIPIIYALFGSLGWAFSLLQETVCLIFLQSSGILRMKTIFMSSLLNMSQICLFISTFAFLVLDLIHRKKILPKYFPNGHVSDEKGVIYLSSGILIAIFYISVGIFPVEFLFSSLYGYGLAYEFDISQGVFVVISLIILFGVGMAVFFADHFSSPLHKLSDATVEMKKHNYDVKVNVVSNDDFGLLADNFNSMAASLDEKSKKILAIQDSIIRGMAVMVEQRDNSTGGHINRTSDCVRVFIDFLKRTNNLEFSPSFCAAVIKAAPMHDLGKIAVDDAVLRKEGRFTDEEYTIMKKHAAAGAVIVEKVLSEVDDEEFKSIAINVAHFHHEKWNGKGYPEGISGTDIPVEARIMALADVFDALVSKRCYKDRMSYDKAFGIIEGDLGSHFDPELGKLFLECRPDLEALYDGYDCDVQ